MGGFPIVALGGFDERSAYQIVEGIYHSVIISDITKRHNIKCNCEVSEKRGAFPVCRSGL